MFRTPQCPRKPRLASGLCFIIAFTLSRCSCYVKETPAGPTTNTHKTVKGNRRTPDKRKPRRVGGGGAILHLPLKAESA